MRHTRVGSALNPNQPSTTGNTCMAVCCCFDVQFPTCRQHVCPKHIASVQPGMHAYMRSKFACASMHEKMHDLQRTLRLVNGN